MPMIQVPGLYATLLVSLCFSIAASAEEKPTPGPEKRIVLFDSLQPRLKAFEEKRKVRVPKLLEQRKVLVGRRIPSKIPNVTKVPFDPAKACELWKELDSLWVTLDADFKVYPEKNALYCDPSNPKSENATVYLFKKEFSGDATAVQTIADCQYFFKDKSIKTLDACTTKIFDEFEKECNLSIKPYADAIKTAIQKHNSLCPKYVSYCFEYEGAWGTAEPCCAYTFEMTPKMCFVDPALYP
jgi:hypothetical protein